MEARVDGGCDCVLELENADEYEVVLLLERFQRFIYCGSEVAGGNGGREVDGKLSLSGRAELFSAPARALARATEDVNTSYLQTVLILATCDLNPVHTLFTSRFM